MVLPERITFILDKALNKNDWDNLIEIRIFKKGMIIIEFYGRKGYVTNDYKVNITDPPLITDENVLEDLFRILTGCSQYAYIENINSGYFTVFGGHRIGIVGSVVTTSEGNTAIKSISAANIRISKNILSEHKIINAQEWGTTAIISPPKCGKTTFLRLVAKSISDSKSLCAICIIDERGEICSCDKGIPFYKLGSNVCVIEGMNKRQAFKMLIKNMSPDVIICDEITEPEEAEAIRDAVLSGVSVIFALHGRDENVLYRKKILEPIVQYIDSFVVLSNKNGPGTVETIERVRK